MDDLRDGVRIAQLLASEIEGHEASLAGVDVVDADPDVEPTSDGAMAYAVSRGGDRVAEVYVHPDRVRVEFVAAQDAAATAAAEAGLRVRPKDVRPPRTLVFVDDGAGVKRVVGAFEAVAAAGRDRSIESSDERGER